MDNGWRVNGPVENIHRSNYSIEPREKKEEDIQYEEAHNPIIWEMREEMNYNKPSNHMLHMKPVVRSRDAMGEFDLGGWHTNSRTSVSSQEK